MCAAYCAHVRVCVCVHLNEYARTGAQGCVSVNLPPPCSFTYSFAYVCGIYASVNVQAVCERQSLTW